MSELGPLDLSGADLKSSFDAVDSGRYNAEIFAMTMDAVKNASGTGKLPAGTPTIKVQFKLLSKITGETDGIENRRVFANYNIPPADYDPAAASKMKGMIANFFIALGDAEETVVSNDFNPDFEDYVGRPCVVVVGKEPKKINGEIVDGEFNNPVKGVKPAGSGVEAESSSLL